MTDSFSRLKLSLLHCGYIRLGNEWRFDGVISPFCRLYFITEGEASIEHHGQTFMLRPGYLYLIPGFSLSRYTCDTSMTQYYISFLEEAESGFSIFDSYSFDYKVQAQATDELIMKRLVNLNPGRTLQNIDPKVYDNQPNLLSFNQPTHAQSASQLMETQGILLQLLSRFIQHISPTGPGQTPSHLSFRTVLTYIHTHLHEKITVDQLATRQQLNVDYFSRQFKSQLGIRPLDYITNKRLERAQLLMTTTDLSLQEITDRVGISDIYYFSRLFKRHFGKPPGQYRKLTSRI